MVEIDQNKIGIIILAAGASTRFGSPKQLLVYQGKPLLKRIAETSISTGFKTLVVLGSKTEEIAKTIENLSVDIAINENWKDGMSSSLKVGLKAMFETHPDFSAVILVLCDQPFVGKDTILKLVEVHSKTEKNIVASEYADTIGTPALFTEEVFDELFELEGDIGAKSLIRKYRDKNLAIVSFPEGAFDVDTPEDFEHLTNA